METKKTRCPHCGTKLEITIAPTGEMLLVDVEHVEII